MRTKWTQAEVEDFERNHEAIMERWQYPPEIVAELRRTRAAWLSSVPRAAPNTSGQE